MTYLKIFTDFRETMTPLTNEEAGALFRAMLLYAENGTESELSGNERYLWIVAKQNIDREKEAYETKVGNMREKGKKGAAARWNRTAQTDGIRHFEDGRDGQDNDNDKYKNNDKGNDISFFQGSGPSVGAEIKPVVVVEREKKETCPPLGGMGSSEGTERKETYPTLEEIRQYVQEVFLPVDPDHFYNYYKANGWMMGSQPMRDWKAALKAWARNAPVAPRPARPQPGSREAFQAAFDMARILEAKRL